MEFHKIIGMGYCIIIEVRLNFMIIFSGKAYAFLFKPRGSGRGSTHFPRGGSTPFLKGLKNLHISLAISCMQHVQSNAQHCPRKISP